MTVIDTAKVRIVARDTRDRLGEGLFWHAEENALYWTDILEQKLHRLDLADARVRSWEMPDTIGWAIARKGGGLVAGIGRTIAAITLDPFGLDLLAELEPERHVNRTNDAKADAAGRLWAGTMPMDGDRPSGAFYRIDPDRRVTRIDDGYHIANGPAFAPREEYLYHTDSALGRIYRFAHKDGALGPRELFIQFEPQWGKPDGMTCDSEGGLWVAHWGTGCISRFTSDGARAEVIDLPTPQITNIVFAGRELDRMFVTSAHDGIDDPDAGHLFEVASGYRGLAPHSFGG